jgi:hypothetical protein
MGELLPVIGGGALGLALGHVQPPGARWPWLTCGSIVVGALASWVNGELSVSASFLLLDVPAAAVSAIVVLRLPALTRATRSERPG